MADHRTRGPITVRVIKRLPSGKVEITYKVDKTGKSAK